MLFIEMFFLFSVILYCFDTKDHIFFLQKGNAVFVFFVFDGFAQTALV